jgi:hypothetical protein
MNSFAIRNMEHHERIFNYRLSRARLVVENVFGILAHKFRVLQAGRGRGKKKLACKYRTHSGSGPPSPSSCCGWLDISV